MKKLLKFLPLINLLILIILTTAIFQLFNQFSAIDVSLNQVRDSEIHHIFSKIDSNFNLILTTMAVIFSLFSLLTFAGFLTQLNLQSSSLKKELVIQKRNWNNHKIEIKNLEGDFSFEVGNSLYEDCNQLLTKSTFEKGDSIRYIEKNLVACEYFAKSLLFKKEINNKFDNSVKILIKDSLQSVSNLCKNDVKIYFVSIGYNRFLKIRDYIEKVCDESDSKNLAFIFSNIVFPDLE